MSIDKIGNMISSMVALHMRVVEKNTQPQLEILDEVFIGTKQEVKEIMTIIDPPFFPICVTQSMFKIVK